MTSLRLLSLLVAFVVLWTLYGTLSGAPASIHNDMAEAYVWGQEFELGYFQHPPFWAWITGAWFHLFPRADWAFYFLSMLNAGLGLLGSWFLLGNFARGDRRLAATWLLLLTPFYTFLALKFNANSIFLSLWPWTMHFFVRSIDERHLSAAALFGLFMGLAFLSKYFAAILAATCLAASLVHPEWRAYYRSAAPYLSMGVALLVFLPHVIWLVSSGAPPIRYFAHKTGHPLATAILTGISLIAGAVAFHAVVIFFIGLTRTARLRWPAASAFLVRWNDPRFRFLLVLALLPLVLTVMAGLLFRLEVSTNMVIGIFSLAPLLVLELAGSGDDRRLHQLARRIALALMLGALVLSPVIAFAKFKFGKDINFLEPRKELAEAVTKIWREATGLPLRYVGGSQRYQNAVVFYSADRPHGIDDLDLQLTRWVTIEDLSRSGFVVVCAERDKACVGSMAAISNPNNVRTIELAHSFWGSTAPPVRFAIALVPPASPRQ